MATSDKLNYLLDTKSKIKNAINNDISLIDDSTIFREYADKINNLSDSLKKYIPTEILEGTSFQIKNAVPLNAKSLIIDGNSYQKTTKGINLYNINDMAQLIIAKVIDDYIDVTFDNSQGTRIRYAEFHTNLSSLINPSTNYTVIAEIIDIFGNGHLRLNSTNNNENVSQFSIGETYSFQNLVKGQTIFYHVTSLENFDNAIRGLRSNVYFVVGESGSLKLRISILEGEITQDNFEYEPFTGGIASPNPNFPQKTEVIEGIKNLFDGNVTKGSYNSTTGNVDSIIYDMWRNTNFIEVEPNQKYIFSLDGVKLDVTIRAFYFNKNKEFISSYVPTINGEFKTPDDCYYLNWHSTALYINYPNGLNKPMISKKIYSYVPYGTWLPFNNTGKNKIGFEDGENQISEIAARVKNNIIILNGQNVQSYAVNIFRSLDVELSSNENKYYTVNYKVINGIKNVKLGISFRTEDGTQLDYIQDNNSTDLSTSKIITASTLNDTKYLYFYVRTQENISNLELEIQLEENSIVTEFEPYRPEEITLIDMNIYDDNGKIIGNHELVKIGATKDDLIVENGIAKIIKRIGKSKIESSMIMTQANILEKSKEIRVLKKSVTSNINQTGKILMMSNAFKYSADTWNNDEIGIFGNAGNPVLNQIAFRVSKDINTETFFDENDVWIYYPLKEPYEIQLSPVKIKMHEGTNNIELSSNLETSMQLEYYKDYKANSEVVGEVTE